MNWEINKKMKKKVLLMILDGWGDGDGSAADVISTVGAEYISSLRAKYPTSTLNASGEAVGLPDGQMGNSEVGHLNLGAGRVVFQDLVKINKECASGDIEFNPIIKEAFTYAKESGKSIHFMGLLSDGGVHSLDKHLYKLTDVAEAYGVNKVYVHAFMDGRDTDPQSGAGYIQNLYNHINGKATKLASIVGRYYAMDRDNRWDRVKRAYDLLVNGEGEDFTDGVSAVRESYANGITDEFIEPLVAVDSNGAPIAKISEGDVVFCYNYRSDRGREITDVLAERNMPEMGMSVINDIKYLTMTPYDDNFKNVSVVYGKENIPNTIGEIISANGLSQLHIAETEKYAHVTFFFNGGREEPFSGENRILIPSPKVATYDLKPEMSAYEVRDAVIKEIEGSAPDFICLNFANGDMVGHTGVYDAIAKAIKVVDESVRAVVESAKAAGYTIIITADHGNADNAVNNDGSVNTAHSTNPVPFIVVSDDIKSVESGVLADVAPTVLKIMGVEKPADMTGVSLV